MNVGDKSLTRTGVARRVVLYHYVSFAIREDMQFACISTNANSLPNIE